MLTDRIELSKSEEEISTPEWTEIKLVLPPFQHNPPEWVIELSTRHHTIPILYNGISQFLLMESFLS